MKIVVEIEDVPFEAILMAKPLWVQLCDENGTGLSPIVSVPIALGVHERQIPGNYPSVIFIDVSTTYGLRQRLARNHRSSPGFRGD